jgi:hypothetical protein
MGGLVLGCAFGSPVSVVGAATLTNAPPGAVASASSDVVVTTATLPDGDTLTSWISGDGLTSVQSLLDPQGATVELERTAFRLTGDEVLDSHLAVFRSEREWAESESMSYCSSICSSRSWIFPPPKTIGQLITSQQFVATGKHSLVDGHEAVELEPRAAAPGATNAPTSSLWINPQNDELLESEINGGTSPTITNYRWLADSTANDHHLELSAPAGFEQISDVFAASAAPIQGAPPPVVSYRSVLEACGAGDYFPEQATATPTFELVRDGVVDGTRWKLWESSSQGRVELAMLGGSGATAQCMSPLGPDQNSYGAVGVSELPGRPVAFAVGLITSSSVTAVDASVENSLKARRIPLHELPGTSDRYAFAEFSGLSCAELNTGGLASTIVVYDGGQNLGGGSSGQILAPPLCNS